MPATLNEAFVSPFDKVLGIGKDHETSSGTTDIRNPHYTSGGISGGPAQPYQQDYRLPQPIMPDYQIGYQYQPAPTPAPVPSVAPASAPRCEQLISHVLMCKICTERLKQLLNTSESQQSGGDGAGRLLSDSSLVTNILIGVTIIFLLDRIFKVRLL